MMSLLHSLRRTWLAAAVIMAPPTASQAPDLEPTTVGSTEGHVRLAWEAARKNDDEFELQIAASEEFEAPETVYRGPDRASFRSGLSPGTHWFRLRARSAPDGEWSIWSAPVAVTVEPYGLKTAWAFFGIGAFLVSAIVGFLMIVGGRELRPGGDA